MWQERSVDHAGGRLAGRRLIGAGGRILGALVLLVPVGAGCTAASGQDELPRHPELDRPPVVRLLAGTRPEGVLVYEEWVTDGQLRTYEAQTVPSDLVAARWRHDDPLVFEIGTGEVPSWVGVLAYEEIPVHQVPDAALERILCRPGEAASACVVDRSLHDSTIRIAVAGVPPGELVILNVGWDLPESHRSHDQAIPPSVSASWAFAVEPTREHAGQAG